MPTLCFLVVDILPFSSIEELPNSSENGKYDLQYPAKIASNP